MPLLRIEDKYLLNAIGAVVLKREVPIPPNEIDEQKLFDLAVSQNVANLLYLAVTQRREFSQRIKTALLEYSDKALYLDALQQTEFELLAKALMKRKISFTPLKGIIIKRFYRSTDMRIMSDIDILVSEGDREAVKEVMLSLGYSDGGTLSYQDIYTKRNDITVEIHYALWGYELEKTSLWEKLFSPSETFFNALPTEDIYIFMIAHIAKHFKTSGIGVRAFLDVPVFLKAVSGSLNRDYVQEQLEILGLTEFEKTIFEIADICFVGSESDSVHDEIISYIMSNGTHGNALQGSVNKLALETTHGIRSNNKVKRAFEIAFPKLEYMKRRYPILEKYPFLLPVFWIVRPFSAMSSKYGGIKRRIDEINNINSEDVEKMRRIFEKCGFISADISHTVDVSDGEPQAEEETETLSLVASIIVCALVASVLIAIIVFVAVFYNKETGNEKNEVSSQDTGENSQDINISLETIVPEGSEYKEIPWQNGIYTGYLVGGVPNGSGTLVFGNGEKYVGGFINGEFNGEGVYHYLGGSRYEGGFANGKLSGTGTLYYESGDIISGVFLDGSPNGECIYMYSGGDVYEGILVNGVRHGNGKYTWSNGDVYEGSFVDGFRSGYGEYTYKKGGTYKGEWENGKQNGVGVYEDNVCTYEGTFVDGLYNGEGKMTWKNGDVYLGAFVEGEMTDASAVFTYKDGTKYTGGFLNGLYNGEGLLEYSDGDKVKGNFATGKINGKAEYYFKATGEWKNVTYTNGVITSYD